MTLLLAASIRHKDSDQLVHSEIVKPCDKVDKTLTLPDMQKTDANNLRSPRQFLNFSVKARDRERQRAGGKCSGEVNSRMRGVHTRTACC